MTDAAPMYKCFSAGFAPAPVNAERVALSQRSVCVRVEASGRASTGVSV